MCAFVHLSEQRQQEAEKLCLTHRSVRNMEGSEESNSLTCDRDASSVSGNTEEGGLGPRFRWCFPGQQNR